MIAHHLALLVFVVGALRGESFRTFKLPCMKPTFSKSTLTRSMSYGEDDGESDYDTAQDTYDVDDFEFPKERQSIYKSSSVKTVETLHNGMKYRMIPNTKLEVSELCMGTMNFGDQLSKKTAFSLLDDAVKDYAINFIDTSEIYPFPFAPTTTGKSELFIGEWMWRQNQGSAIVSGSSNTAPSSVRDKLVLSTKVAGHSPDITWLRADEAPTRLTRKQIIEAVDGSLRRLGTDYIDLLQFHWPDRNVFAPSNGMEFQYGYDNTDGTPLEEQLRAIEELQKSGKIRYFGLSDETVYGLTNTVKTAEFLNLPKPATLQVPLNLLTGRNDLDTGILEACSPGNCDVALLAHTPLAGGTLSGKYLDLDSVLMSARMRKYVGYQYRYLTQASQAAIRAYKKVIDPYDIPMSVVALAWVATHPAVLSTIIGATSREQLKQNVRALNVYPFPPELLHQFEPIYTVFREPSKGPYTMFDLNEPYERPEDLPLKSQDEDFDTGLVKDVEQDFSVEAMWPTEDRKKARLTRRSGKKMRGMREDDDGEDGDDEDGGDGADEDVVDDVDEGRPEDDY